MRAVVVAVCLLAPVPARSPAQANYTEGLDNNGENIGCTAGPSNLINLGWVFRRQSADASACWVFTDGDPSYFPPQQGAGYLAAHGDPRAGGIINTVSNWAIVPAVPGQAAGDVISFWLFGSAANEVNFEVRYSPTGGTSTGSGPLEVGDFTELLLDIPSPFAPAWQLVQTTVPAAGGGRIALRLRGSVSGFSVQVGIDTLSVGGEPPPPCQGYPPIPEPGKTVTWTAAGGPYRVCADVVIPATSTVLVEPGAVVQIDPQRLLVVDGTLRATGAPGKPATFTTAEFSGRLVSNGHTELNHVTLDCPLVYPSGATTIILRDSVINAAGRGALGLTPNASYVWDTPPTIIVERCKVTGNGANDAFYFSLDHCHGLVRDTSLTGVTAVMDGYLLLENVTSTGAPQDGISFNEQVRNLYLGDLNITGAAEACLDLTLVHHAYLDASNTLQGSQYAVKANSLLPGSVVPPTGNTFNHVLAAGAAIAGGKTWSDVGVPWGWNAPNYNVGTVRIAPNVTVLMYPDMFLASDLGRISAEGLPEAPVVFTPLDSLQPWLSILELVSEGSRYDRCIIEGAAEDALLAFDCIIHADNCLFRSNAIGLTAAENGTTYVRKSNFTMNEVGVFATDDGLVFLSDPAAPSAIAGNTVGMVAQTPFLGVFDARNVWWNHTTGPTAAHNPGGQGDQITGFGASFVEIEPFLIEPPKFTDQPPVVRTPSEAGLLNEPGALETGSKYILHWTADDDSEIVSQRVLFSPWINGPNLFTVIADNLPPTQRSLEFTVPDVDLVPGRSYIRVEAVDAAGQIGWDEFPTLIPAGDTDVHTTITSDFAGLVIRAGENLPGSITYTPVIRPPGLRADFYIHLDADEYAVGLGGWFADRGFWDVTETPFVSTDLARLAIVVRNNLNDSETFYGEYFSIRPDPLLGDAPPQVTLVSPQGGSFRGGSVIPISWSAFDDELVRSMKIQASYDGGRTWHTIAEDLPGDSTQFAWRLPPSTGIADVRVRAIARDKRLQSSSSTGGPFTILPGA
jgi:hypothetical protein